MGGSTNGLHPGRVDGEQSQSIEPPRSTSAAELQSAPVLGHRLRLVACCHSARARFEWRNASNGLAPSGCRLRECIAQLVQCGKLDLPSSLGRQTQRVADLAQRLRGLT